MRLKLKRIHQENVYLRQKLEEEKQKTNCLEKEIDRLLNKESDKLETYHCVVNKTKYASAQRKQKKYDEILKKLSSKKYHSTNKLSQRILGDIIATHPASSFEVVADIVCLARVQLLVEVGIIDIHGDRTRSSVSFEDVARSSPSEATFRNAMDQAASDVMFTIHHDIFCGDGNNNGEYQRPAVFASCDKGTGGNLVKIINWYSPSESKVVQKIIDVDISGATSEGCAKAM